MAPRTPEEIQESRRRCKMAYAVNKAMAHDLPVVLSNHYGTVIAEGRIVKRERDDNSGVLVYLEDLDDPIPLPLIKTMALQKGRVGSDSLRNSAAGAKSP